MNIQKCFSFPIVRNSNENDNSKQYLIMKNNGDADCVFSVLTETEFQKKQNISEYITMMILYYINNNLSKRLFAILNIYVIKNLRI